MQAARSSPRYWPGKTAVFHIKALFSGLLRRICVQDPCSFKFCGDFIFLGAKITADGDCSHDIKRHLFLGRKVMTNLESESEVAQSCPTLRLHGL